MQMATVKEERVDALMERTTANFRRHVLGHPFMTDLEQGILTRQRLHGFLLNWYTWVFEINMAAATWLHRFGPVLKAHPDLMEVVNDKIADELITPTKGGHIQTLEALALALGLERDQLVHYQLIPEARAWLDYFVRLQTEGTFAECVAGYLGEGCFPEVAAVWERALTTHYGLRPEDVLYFRLHGEQDLEHKKANLYILRKLCEVDLIEERPGWSLEYANSTSGQLFVLFLDGVYRRYGGAREDA